MHIVIVAPCLLPCSIIETGATPPQLAMHLAASTPVRHRVQIVDAVKPASFCWSQADLYVLLWTQAFSPELIEIALQLATCEPLVCVWAGPTMAPTDYLLEFCDHVVCNTQDAWWQRLLTSIEAERVI